MTKKAPQALVDQAVLLLQEAADLQLRDLLLMYVLVDEGNLWHHFPPFKQIEIRNSFQEYIDLGYPASMKEYKERYPELFKNKG